MRWALCWGSSPERAMRVEAAIESARASRLYPAVILGGGSDESRRAAAERLARALLCDSAAPDRPCGICRHCRRIVAPEGKAGAAAPFHPDVRWLERDLRTSTSVEATRGMLQLAHFAPFEARGQVFVVLNAETLTPEAENALLKMLEEPPMRAPRHFLLLAPSHLDLLPTVRSRSLAVYLGPLESVVEDDVERCGALLAGYWQAGVPASAADVLRVASRLAAVGDFSDSRAARPWATASAALLRSADVASGTLRFALLQLAEDLLSAPELRLRGIPAERLLEGLVARRFSPLLRVRV